jgi:5-methylcytosine-specific restriction endonuclease McrA
MGVCQVCFSNGNVVHHVDGSGKTGSRNIDENNSPANLILLCRRCHSDIHRLGNKDTRQRAAVLVACEQTKETKTRERALLTGWKKLRLQIKERDKSECVLCHEKDKKIVVHHIDGQGLFCQTPNNNPENLITLCQSCHNAITNLRANGSKKTSPHLILALGPGTTGTPV